MNINYCIIIFGLSVIFSGCKDSTRYRKTLEFGKKEIKWAKEMESWYGQENVDHIITHYKFDEKKPVTWTSIAYLYGRYELWMKVEIEINYENCKITNISKSPQFFASSAKSVGES